MGLPVGNIRPMPGIPVGMPAKPGMGIVCNGAVINPTIYQVQYQIRRYIIKYRRLIYKCKGFIVVEPAGRAESAGARIRLPPSSAAEAGLAKVMAGLSIEDMEDIGDIDDIAGIEGIVDINCK